MTGPGRAGAATGDDRRRHAAAGARTPWQVTRGARGPDVLIVVDDDASREALATGVDGQAMTCRAAADLAAARVALARSAPDLGLLDLVLPDGNGLDLFDSLRELPDTDVVMISGRTTVDMAIEALRLGARDFLTKPLVLPRLASILERLGVAAARRHELRRVRDELRHAGRFGDIVGS